MDEQTLNRKSAINYYLNFYIFGPPKTGWAIAGEALTPL